MEKIPTMLFVVALALINQDNEILLQKRPEGRLMAGLWEFPGGKVETGETPESALIREIEEELGVGITSQDLTQLTFASESLGDKNLLLLLYVARNWTGTPVSLENAETMWVDIDQMRALEMPPADLPFIDRLADYIRRMN